MSTSPDSQPLPNTNAPIITERLLNAPRERVFEAFSDPAILAQWWGPEGCTNLFHEFEFRAGGAWRYEMQGSDGTTYQLDKEFLEVAPPERIVVQNLQLNHGFEITMTFEEAGEQTRLQWVMRFEDPEEAERVRDFVKVANEQNFDRLEAQLAKG